MSALGSCASVISKWHCSRYRPDMRYILLLCSLLANLAYADVYFGRVVSVSDGDTITVLDGSKRQHKIRLGGIDAPEKHQPFGARSKQHLSELVFGKDVQADCVKIDRYMREICKISVNGVDANLEQIKSGMAWWYRTYAKDQLKADQTAYSLAEKEAREARRGLWSDAESVAPWEWRREEKQKRSVERDY